MGDYAKPGRDAGIGRVKLKNYAYAHNLTILVNEKNYETLSTMEFWTNTLLCNKEAKSGRRAFSLSAADGFSFELIGSQCAGRRAVAISPLRLRTEGRKIAAKRRLKIRGLP